MNPKRPFERVQWAYGVCKHHGIRGYPVSVLVNLAHRWSHSEGKAWPSMDRIADDVGIARSTVQKALKTLMRAKIITRTYPKGRRSNGGRYANEYSLKFDAYPCTDSANHVPPDGIGHVPPDGTQQDIYQQGIDSQHSVLNRTGSNAPNGGCDPSLKSQIYKISQQVNANRGLVAKTIAEIGEEETEVIMLEALEDALVYGPEGTDVDYILGSYLENG